MLKGTFTVEELQKGTNFSRGEIYHLTEKFTGTHSLKVCLQKELISKNTSTPTINSSASHSLPTAHIPQDKLDRSKFRDLLSKTFGIDYSLIMDRVFRCVDVDSDNYISHEEFIRGMSTLLKGKPEEMSRFCFKVYDLNGDRYISKEEMFQLLKNCLIKGTEEDDDGVKDLVDLVMKKLDEDRDGRVSETDWHMAIGKDSLLLEAFGQCLPTNESKRKYMNFKESDVKVWEDKYKTRTTIITSKQAVTADQKNAKQTIKTVV